MLRIILLLLLAAPTLCSAQGRLDIGLPSGTRLDDVPVYSFRGDSIYVGDSLAPMALHVGDIQWIRKDRGTFAVSVGSAGLCVGLIAGAVWHLDNGGSIFDIVGTPWDDDDDRYPYDDDDDEPMPWRMLVGGLGGAAIGGAIGLMFPRSEIVVLDGAGIEVRLAEVGRLLAE